MNPQESPFNEESDPRELRQKVDAARQANRDFLGLENPTAAQNATQVQRLTRQVQELLSNFASNYDAKRSK